ncbi:hypothetical protein SAMN05421839_10222 [Halolactibacillus halophilus]|uniref:Uncharacterized protein n=1 Tax=Halolactibacillus halophilus TaxID=306540 RepID=A0A1I5LDI6_9BACI|nr:hypothetical protein [Halolactibacillus halophilus]GEM00870.1 hypothetical protein HHA03_04020 [Halolactibacillus halophilus]SFO95434.1 hypothetical protein SAMN05421839_10222 [Halolactibacillus halophilus]
MSIEQHYLKRDHNQLSELINAVHGNSLQAIQLAMEGKNEEARLCSLKITHCLKEINKLKQKKIETDVIRSLLNQIKERELTDQMLQMRKDWL